MMNDLVAQAFEDEAEARAIQAEADFEALLLPEQPIGRYASKCGANEYVFTWDQLIGFALEDRESRP